GRGRRRVRSVAARIHRYWDAPRRATERGPRGAGPGGMAVRPLRTPDPLRLRPETRLDVPRCRRRVRPRPPGAVSARIPVFARDSPARSMGDPRLSRADGDARLLPNARDLGFAR